MPALTIPDKVTGDVLTAPEFQQIIDALKNGLISIKTASVDMNQIQSPGYPTISLNDAAGNLNGTYVYRITFVTADGETEAGEVSNSLAVTNKQISLSNIPVSSDTRVTSRKIYRSDGNSAGGGWLYRMQCIGIIDDNTTTAYTDNTAQAEAGAYLPTVNTTGGNISVNGDGNIVVTIPQVSVGVEAAAVNHGYYATAIGYRALAKNTYGYYNTAIGAYSMEDNTIGYYNLALGTYALRKNTTGFSNVAVGGERTLEQNTIGSCNTAIGDSALTSNIDGVANSAVGNRALRSNTSGLNNIAIGQDSVYSNITGNSNIGIGVNSLYAATVATANIAIGFQSLNHVTGSYNVALGNDSLKTVVSGTYNTAIGNSCLYSTTGSQNVAVGCYAGNKLIAGASNIFIGYGAGNHNSQLTTASSSIAIGVNAYTTKDNQVVIGNDTTVETVLKGDVVFGKTKTPSSATDVGVAGTVSWDAGYIYVCVATNTWKRVAIASW